MVFDRSLKNAGIALLTMSMYLKPVVSSGLTFLCARNSASSMYANVSQPFIWDDDVLTGDPLTRRRERADVGAEPGVAVVDDVVGAGRQRLVARAEHRLLEAGADVVGEQRDDADLLAVG